MNVSLTGKDLSLLQQEDWMKLPSPLSVKITLDYCWKNLTAASAKIRLEQFIYYLVDSSP